MPRRSASRSSIIPKCSPRRTRRSCAAKATRTPTMRSNRSRAARRLRSPICMRSSTGSTQNSNSVTVAFPNRKLHVILDNLNTHKKNEHWLKAHPDVQFHFTPTSASWLNQVEIWFSILQGQSLSGTSFTSLKQLELHIDAYIKAYNDKAEPFVWTKKKVRQRRFKGRRITQL